MTFRELASDYHGIGLELEKALWSLNASGL